jgi:hypothetical protein
MNDFMRLEHFVTLSCCSALLGVGLMKVVFGLASRHVA